MGTNILNIWVLDYRFSYKIAIVTCWLFILPSFFIMETLYFSQSNLNIKEMFLNTLKLVKINKKKSQNKIKKIFMINLNE